VIAFRPEVSLLYVNADAVLEAVLGRFHADPGHAVGLVVCDLSASPRIDLAGARMLHELQGYLAGRGIPLRIVGARAFVRDLLRADGVADKVGGLYRAVTLHDVLESDRRGCEGAQPGEERGRDTPRLQQEDE
jgi:sulfate permease, SulP family